jgi:hypothetical protein
MDEHISALQAHIRVREMVARWYREQDCHFRTWSLFNFILQGFMALAYVKSNKPRPMHTNALDRS